jgi:hypothetical protein
MLADGGTAAKLDDLTRSEGQIEDLFSEGESTKAERLKKPRVQKPPPKRPAV